MKGVEEYIPDKWLSQCLSWPYSTFDFSSQRVMFSESTSRLTTLFSDAYKEYFITSWDIFDFIDAR